MFEDRKPGEYQCTRAGLSYTAKVVRKMENLDNRLKPRTFRIN